MDFPQYDFLIFHPDFEDCDSMLPQIKEKYPSTPKIFPSGSVAEAGLILDQDNGFPVRDVFKDPKDQAYSVYAGNFEDSVLKLIEYLLDQKECSRPQQP